jgi:hypothetical protein
LAAGRRTGDTDLPPSPEGDDAPDDDAPDDDAPDDDAPDDDGERDT